MGYSTESHGIPPLQLFTQTRAFQIPASMTRSIRIPITAARTPAVDGPGPTRHPAFSSPGLLDHCRIFGSKWEFRQRLAHQGYRAGHPRWDSVESVSLAVLVSRIGRVAEIRMREIFAALAVAVDCSL